jgi:hypothetical protein
MIPAVLVRKPVMDPMKKLELGRWTLFKLRMVVMDGSSHHLIGRPFTNSHLA